MEHFHIKSWLISRSLSYDLYKVRGWKKTMFLALVKTYMNGCYILLQIDLFKHHPIQHFASHGNIV